jgi:ketosteroid isomerase-like protein
MLRVWREWVPGDADQVFFWPIGGNFMKNRVLLLACCGFVLALAALPQRLASGQAKRAEETSQKSILSVLNEQQEAWNHADVERFMKSYWKSPQLTFAGSTGITRGWEPVLDRYRKRYPDAAAMGHLDFSELEVYPLGNDAALVMGRWQLKRSSGNIGGVFTLVFRRFPEGWRIIHDHTSADEKTP